MPMPTLEVLLSNTNDDDPFAAPESLKMTCVFEPATGPAEPVNPIDPVNPVDP